MSHKPRDSEDQRYGTRGEEEENGKEIFDFEDLEFEENREVAAKDSKTEKWRYNYEVGEWIELDLIAALPQGKLIFWAKSSNLI